MSSTLTVIEYQVKDALRTRGLVLYALALFLITYGLFRFSGDTATVLLSITNLTLVLVPLVSMLFGALHLYNSHEFIELLLTHPISRSTIFRGLFWGTALPLAGAFLVGAGAPLVLYGFSDSSHRSAILLLLSLGVVLTLLSTGIAFIVAILTQDRAKGCGLILFVWLAAAVLYDGAILLLVLAFQDYPLERVLIGVTFFNPIDLVRIQMLLKLDVSALMGYTGAVFERSFGSHIGQIAAGAALAGWAAFTYGAGMILFRKRDF